MLLRCLATCLRMQGVSVSNATRSVDHCSEGLERDRLRRATATTEQRNVHDLKRAHGDTLLIAGSVASLKPKPHELRLRLLLSEKFPNVHTDRDFL